MLHRHFALLLILFQLVAVAAPALADIRDDNQIVYSLPHQNLQAPDIIEEVPVSATCIISRVKAPSNQPIAVTRDTQVKQCTPFREENFAIAQSKILPRPGYYGFIFRYSLF